ncbi:MAG: relaxation protein [Rhodanobacter sp.]|jgi:hypothetical protein|nr:relaxation protein [Rhodanobacter sp.]ODT90002.1 MAG: hypothetical protein ABS82_17335 [Rhodanobacter sp. SCN 67-45]
MNETECMTLVSQAAQLMEQFERRCDHLGGRLQGLMQDMQALATQLPRVVEQAADASMQALPARVAHETREGLGQAVQYYRQHLQASGEEVSGSAHALAERIERLERLHRHLLWKTFGAVALCLALLLAGGAWLSLHYRKVIEQNQLSAQLLKAYNDADVNLCDGQLCARVDLKAPRFGERRQYLPVLPR